MPQSNSLKLQEEIAKKIVTAFNKLNVEPIALLIHPQFVFKYQGNSPWTLKGEARYLGILCQTFVMMKQNGQTTNASLYFEEVDGEKFAGVMLLPPHNPRLLYPIELQDRKNFKKEFLPEQKAILSLQIKNEKLFRIFLKWEYNEEK